METLYLILIVILFILAISDLVVGVSNDAVNFLNSAIGAKAAPFKIIMLVAALGIIFGATFSSGMMEVARKGIFHPDQFYFSEIMIIFLAVMLTDVILLDVYNTFGLPTSTTVSIVFELLGAAVAVSIIKISNNADTLLQMSDYINSAKALAIISGILLSVIIAFAVGAFVQYLTRLIFTFNYKKYMRAFGPLWGGLAITAITYFILIKGAKGSSFLTDETLHYIKTHGGQILLFSFIGWTVILQMITFIVRFNILRVIVLVGTFALAMAFASNDLVNFIGVPLAGLRSFQEFIANPQGPDELLMSALKGEVKTATPILLIAGLIMVITLYFSRKAKSVVATTIDLSRQDEGTERFGASLLSRALVRGSRNTATSLGNYLPYPFKRSINKRFERYRDPNEKPGSSFDMIRASVNLVVASILISIGTNLKLPLSTTYVTFMVAMGTSLADGAWGRESAVYRITGVLSVIGGWFLTAISAFTAAFVIANLIHLGGAFAIGGLVIIAIILIIRTHRIHRTKEKEKQESATEDVTVLEGENVLEGSQKTIVKHINKIPGLYDDMLHAFYKEDRKRLKKIRKDIIDLDKKVKKQRDNINLTIERLKEDSVETGHYYVQVIDYLREIAHATHYIIDPVYEHVENVHKGFIEIQIEELEGLTEQLRKLFDKVSYTVEHNEFHELDKVYKIQVKLLDTIDALRKSQLKRLKKKISGTNTTMLYLTILQETKNLSLFVVNMLKSYRDFVVYTNGGDRKKTRK
ncbi:MAG: inorganic phosphate transporter [Bacteroidales bacterium]|nr:inorganic phosphate transporter [Bacteroidales bacterium]